MKILALYDYPPSPAGLATQGDLLCRGLRELGMDVHAAHFESPQEKEWYYRWFEPDVVVGIGFWGHSPHLVLHPLRCGMRPVPWFVADGYVAAYHDVLNSLPLILVTSNWVRETYIRDGINADLIEVLPVGCDTGAFVPRDRNDPKVLAIREALGVADDQIMILTVGGDATSKGAQEVMQALALIDQEAPDWKYVCKVWPQPRTTSQNLVDLQLAHHLGIDKNVVYTANVVSRNFMPYLLAACDIYAAPSRLEGFGMIQVEANACGKPVIAINAMAFLDTMRARRNGAACRRGPGDQDQRNGAGAGPWIRRTTPHHAPVPADRGLPGIRAGYRRASAAAHAGSRPAAAHGRSRPQARGRVSSTTGMSPNASSISFQPVSAFTEQADPISRKSPP